VRSSSSRWSNPPRKKRDAQSSCFNWRTRLSDVTVWSVDLTGGDLASAEAVSINWGESLGYAPGEMPADLGSSLDLIVLPEDRAGLLAKVQAYLDGRSEKFEAEYRVRHKDGHGGLDARPRRRPSRRRRPPPRISPARA